MSWRSKSSRSASKRSIVGIFAICSVSMLTSFFHPGLDDWYCDFGLGDDKVINADEWVGRQVQGFRPEDLLSPLGCGNHSFANDRILVVVADHDPSPGECQG